MQYVIFVLGDDGTDTLHAGPVPETEAAYLRAAIEHLQPLADDDYTNGPVAIMRTLARTSYVLDGTDLYWLAEWQPGLIVVRLAGAEPLRWVALRSPVPDFGGRTPLPQDEVEPFDEDDNPQYELIFTPWDAQFEPREREWGSFAPADGETVAAFTAALVRVNRLIEAAPQPTGDAADDWFERCKANVAARAGEGVRIER